MKKVMLILSVCLLCDIYDLSATDNYFTDQIVAESGGSSASAADLRIDNLAALGNAAVLDGERSDAIKYKSEASAAETNIQFRHIISVGHYSLPKIQNLLSDKLTVEKLIEFGHLLYLDNEYRVQSMAKPSSFYAMRHRLDLRAANAGSLGIITSVKWGSRVNQTLSDLTVNDVRNLFQDCRYDEECEDWRLSEEFEGKEKVEEHIKALAAERGVTL